MIVGYATTKRDLISSVASVETSQISNLPVVNISQGLVGRSPSLIVQQSGGGINVNPTISIRGGGEPLYVINGAIRTKSDLVSLSPEDIEQMNILKNADHRFKRSTFRVAETCNLKKFGIQINATVDGYTQSMHEPRGTLFSGVGSVFSELARSNEAVVFNKYGLPLWNGNYNLYAQTTKEARYIHANTSVVNAKGEIIWNIPWVMGLKAKASSNYRYYYYDNKTWAKNAVEYEWDSTTPIYVGSPSLTMTNDKNVGYANQVFLEYANQFGKHSVSAVGGFEQYYEKSSDYYLQRTNYEFQVDQISVGSADSQTNGGSEAELGRATWIGQARYNYANKYYLEGAIRYDGSDYFAPRKRWGAFVGGSLGWVVTTEPFMKRLIDKNILNILKLRAPYGETGLDSSAGRFAYMQAYTLNATSYVVDGSFASGFTEGALPPKDLTWYTTDQTDIGFDFSSMANRLYGSFDYFFYKTYGYLVAPTGQSYLNSIIGISMPKVKSESEYRREGIEIQLGWRDAIGDFSYDVSVNVTYFLFPAMGHPFEQFAEMILRGSVTSGSSFA